MRTPHASRLPSHLQPHPQPHPQPHRQQLLRRLARGWRVLVRRSRPGGHPGASRRAVQQGAFAEPALVAVPSGDEPRATDRRCGWFDSSQDLCQGVCVSEHGADDAVCAQLSVAAWVQLRLSGWKPELESAQA
jgi:hypothetical protein